MSYYNKRPRVLGNFAIEQENIYKDNPLKDTDSIKTLHYCDFFPADILYDGDKDCFFNENGVIFEGFDFSKTKDVSLEQEKIVLDLTLKYPDYHFVFKEGKIPFRFHTIDYLDNDSNDQYSTHILYITNYDYHNVEKFPMQKKKSS